MPKSDVPLDIWKNLYEVALRFRDLAPWTWMKDVDLFGVKDPISGEIGYCCIIGALGEVYGLVVYLGNNGLQAHHKICDDVLERDSFLEMRYVQDCIKGEFADRIDLNKEDIEVIKDLGFKFRGRHQYPVFRRYKPGYFPWFISIEEAEFLTICFEKAIEISEMVKNNSFDITDLTSEKMPIFVYDEQRGWCFKHFSPKVFPTDDQKLSLALQVDEVQIKRIQKANMVKSDVWEADVFFLPTPVRGDDRPFFPRTTFLIEQKTTFILDTELINPREEPFLRLWNTITRAIETHRLQPKEIHLKDRGAVALLAPLGEKLGIEIKHKERLNTLEVTKMELFDTI